MNQRLSVEEVNRLDPYQFMAELGKKVIHPGGSRSTDEMLEFARLDNTEHVLEVGCGVGTTAMKLARACGARVTAVDIDAAMLEKARANVRSGAMEHRVNIERGDIQGLPYLSDFFDCVFVEAVTMFVNREKAAREVFRVCRRGGRVLDHEFIWRKPPPMEARAMFEGEVCPGINFDTPEDWVKLYREAGLKDIQIKTGSFAMMTPAGFIRDEGSVNLFLMMVRCMSRWAYMKKMAWLMSRMVPVMPYLGYVVIAGKK